MEVLRKIDPAPFRSRVRTMPKAIGEKPELRFVAIASMRLDPAYQREILQAGARNVIKIAESFDWSKFTPVVLSRTSKDLFNVIDGQHRATAAALRGIDEIPAAIYKTDRAAQAAAFAAINGEVTAISTLALYRAQLAAGDAQARDIDAICKRAGITIPATNPAGQIGTKLGETVAVRALERCLVRYGTDILVMALQGLVACPGSIGMIRRPAIGGMCAVLDAEPEFQNLKALKTAMATFDFKAAWSAASKAQLQERCTIESKLVDLFADHIERCAKTRKAA